MTLEQMAAELMALRERVAVIEARQQSLTVVAPPKHYTPQFYEVTC